MDAADDLPRPDQDHDPSRRRQPGAERGGEVIARSHRHRQAGRQPGEGSACAAQAARQLSAGAIRGSSRGVELEAVQQRGVVVLAIEVIDHAGGGQGMIDHGNPRQPLDHEGDGLMKPRNRPVGGEMAFQPADLGGEMAGIEHQPADLPYELGRNIGDLRRRPPIHPGEARRQRIAVRIDGDAAVELAADSDRPYGGWFGAPGCQRLGDRGPQGVFPKAAGSCSTQPGRGWLIG